MLQYLRPGYQFMLLCLFAAALCCCGKPGEPTAEPLPAPGTPVPGNPPAPGTGNPPTAGKTYFDATVNGAIFAATVYHWYYPEPGMVNIEGRNAAGDQITVAIHMGPQLKWGTYAWYMEPAYKLAQMTFQPAADLTYLSGYKNCAGIPVYSAGSAGITRLDPEGGQTFLTGNFSATVYETGHCNPVTSKKITGIFRVKPR